MTISTPIWIMIVVISSGNSAYMATTTHEKCLYLQKLWAREFHNTNTACVRGAFMFPGDLK